MRRVYHRIVPRLSAGTSQWIVPLAGITAAALVAWSTCPLPLPPFRRIPPLALFVLAFRNLAFTFIASVAVMIAVCAWLRRPIRFPFVVSTSADAMLFVPLFVFLSEKSIWAVPIAAILAAFAVPRFVREQRACMAPGLLYSLGAAVCLQAAAVTGLTDRIRAAAALLAVATAVVAWRAVKVSGIGRRRIHVLPVFMIAAVFTAGGLSRFVMGGAGGASSPGETQTGRPPDRDDGGDAAGGVYRGVILWRDLPLHKVIVPPAPRAKNALARRTMEPLSIPFDGVYFIFRAPAAAPPKGSVETHGDPAAITFRSTDRRPLIMEAEENLGTLIDLNCCSRIEVAITNGDRYPATVSLELILLDTSQPNKPRQSLGIAAVSSTPARPRPGGAPVLENLVFEIPSSAAIARFDAVKFRFRVNALRSDRSPRIAIDRLTLVPAAA